MPGKADTNRETPIWFRFYKSALRDPKVQLMTGDLFKFWVNLLCVAADHGGIIPSTEELMIILPPSSKKVITRSVEDLLNRGLLDRTEDQRIVVHNWSDRQKRSDSSRERTRKWRNGFGDSKTPSDVASLETSHKRHGNVTVTALELDIDLELEKKKERTAALGSDTTPFRPLFDRFIEEYPNKSKVNLACQTLISMVDRGDVTEESFTEILSGLGRWKESRQWAEDGGKYIPNPANFLRDRLWEDDPPKSDEALALARQLKPGDGSDPYTEYVPAWKRTKDE